MNRIFLILLIVFSGCNVFVSPLHSSDQTKSSTLISTFTSIPTHQPELQSTSIPIEIDVNKFVSVKSIQDYLIQKIGATSFGGKVFSAYQIIGTEQAGQVIHIYLWTLVQEYYVEQGSLKDGTATSEPVVLFVEMQDGRYRIVDYKDAGEGYQYLTKNFPPNIISLINEPAAEYNLRVDHLSDETKKQAETYFGVQSTLTPEATRSAQSEPINAGDDLKRGTFFSEDINNQLGNPTQEQTINDVQVSISNIVRKDTRAFVKVCMQLTDSNEPLDFGTTYLDYPGGKAENFFVQTNIASLGNARCIVLEFVGIPQDTSSKDWKFTMEWTGYLAPDEGTECSAYLRRAQSNKLVQQNGIKFSCKTTSGQTEIHIDAKPNEMSDDQANTIINQAFSGVINGPWIFAPTVIE